MFEARNPVPWDLSPVSANVSMAGCLLRALPKQSSRGSLAAQRCASAAAPDRGPTFPFVPETKRGGPARASYSPPQGTRRGEPAALARGSPTSALRRREVFRNS